MSNSTEFKNDVAIYFLNKAKVSNDGHGFAIARNGLKLRAWFA